TSLLFVFPLTAPTEISSLSLHDALPISVDLDLAAADLVEHVGVEVLGSDDGQRAGVGGVGGLDAGLDRGTAGAAGREQHGGDQRSEEHTSELQSRENLVCRLLLEKKNKI